MKVYLGDPLRTYVELLEEEIQRVRDSQFRTVVERYVSQTRLDALEIRYLNCEKVDGEIITKLIVTEETFGDGLRLEMQLFRPYTTSTV